MNKGRTIAELAVEVERQASLKRDFVAPTSSLNMMPDGNFMEINGKENSAEIFGMNDTIHRQISTNLKIPAAFYDRIKMEYPDLLAINVNALFHRKPQNRMVRTLDSVARAFLSPRYRRRDHVDLMEHILPVLIGKDLRVISCEITPSRLYVKFVSLSVEGEVKTGDLVQAGGVISNSETGLGSVSAFPFILRKICDNGMIINELGQRKYHVGKQIEMEEDSAMEIYADDTLQADDEAFWKKMRDTVAAVVNQTTFEVLLNRLRESTNQKLEGKPEAVVTELANRYQINEGHRDSILRHLIDDGVGYSAYGLANAVTSVAGEQTDYAESTRLESVGGSIISLQPSQWKEISLAA